MNYIDDKTAILSDGTIVNFYDDGVVELFPGTNEWNKPKDDTIYGVGKCHRHEFKTIVDAKKVFEQVNILLQK